MENSELIMELLKRERSLILFLWLDCEDVGLEENRLFLAQINAEIARRIPQCPEL